MPAVRPSPRKAGNPTSSVRTDQGFVGQKPLVGTYIGFGECVCFTISGPCAVFHTVVHLPDQLLGFILVPTRSSSPSSLLQGLCLAGRLARGSVVGKGLSASVRLGRLMCRLAAAPSLCLELSPLHTAAIRLLGRVSVTRNSLATKSVAKSVANVLRSISRSIDHPLLAQGI